MRRLSKKLLKIALVPFLLCAGFLLFSNGLILSYGVADTPDKVPPREYALLLGTSKFTYSGMVNPYYRYRIVAAAELYKAGKVKKIIASGDNSTKYYNEPATMRADLVASGVAERDIIMDFAGLRTLDSVVRCRDKFGVSAPVIITQKYHAHRALFLSKKFGLDGAVAYAAKSPDTLTYRLRNELRESLARAKAVLDFYVLKTTPKYSK